MKKEKGKEQKKISIMDDTAAKFAELEQNRNRNDMSDEQYQEECTKILKAQMLQIENIQQNKQNE